MSVKNAKSLPKLYFGIHMAPGVAEYREPGNEPYRIFINEDAIKAMDASFQGKPVYVRHVDGVDLDNLQAEADGYVVRSFYNEKDGRHWVEFLVVSDRGHEAIAKGWKLSNAYIPKEMVGGGLWHGVEYSKEVKRGEYEHLAIVPDPRYEESRILTPEQFKEYNAQKAIELSRVANSKGEKSMLTFWKKAKVENSTDLESTVVQLPKSKKELTITELVNNMDAMMTASYANGDHKVKVGEEEMTVNELVEKHLAMKASMKNEDKADADAHAAEAKGEGEMKANDEDAEAKKKAEEIAAHEQKEIEEKKANEAKAAEEEKAKQNALDAEKKANFEKLKNAQSRAEAKPAPVIETSSDQVARGKARYGSN